MSPSAFGVRACRRRSNMAAMTILIAALAGAGPAAAQTAAPTPAKPSAPAAKPTSNQPAPVQPSCPAQPEMTFTSWSNPLGQAFGEGSRDYIFADGFICTDTAQKFQQFLTAHPPKPDTTVVLNSGGGDLANGMQMGALIRQQKLWTEVGSFFPLIIPSSPNIKPQSVPYLSESAVPPFAGGCYSACNFAFMGGVRRTMNYGSNFGVHQFESDNPNLPNLQDATERMSAAIVKFLTAMGISPSWIVYMAQKRGPVTDLTMQQMQDLHVVTPRWQTRWRIVPLANGSGFSLQGTTTDAWGTDTVVFACAPQTSPSPAASTSSQQQPALIATFSLDPGVRAKAHDLIGAVAGYSIELSGDVEPISLTAKQAPPAQVAGDRLVLTLPLNRAIVADLTKNGLPASGVVAFLFNPTAAMPMRLLKFEANLDSALFKQFVATCH
jgi:hypothetical protein